MNELTLRDERQEPTTAELEEQAIEKAKTAQREHQSKAGTIGGRSRSEKKRASSSANLAKARIKRWAGREKAATLEKQIRDVANSSLPKRVKAAEISKLQRQSDDPVDHMLAEINGIISGINARQEGLTSADIQEQGRQNLERSLRSCADGSGEDENG